jgi:group I intron endonuclease
MTQCIVYQALNTNNGKRYVGATERGLRVRKRKHLANAKRGQAGKFYTAIRKHGASAFVFSVLVECRDFWHALEEERRLIEEMKPEYNLTEGGGGVKGLQFSAQSKAKMSASAKKRWHAIYPPRTEEEKKERLTRLHRKGTKISDPRLLAERRSIMQKATEARQRPVRCVTDNIPFVSATRAASHYGISTASIVLYCQKKVKPKSGLVFEYEGRAHV